MRRVTLWLLSTVAAVVLLFSYRTSTGGGASATIGAAVSGDGGTSTSTTNTSSAGTSSGGTTYKGSVAQTRWGPVQVTITVSNGKISSVAVPIYPSGNGRDQEINSYALPILQRETISAQSAGIDAVSGATVTSDGYKESLQAALDAAHLS
jgi:uncharacterized protein with FMN-binding domain